MHNSSSFYKNKTSIHTNKYLIYFNEGLGQLMENEFLTVNRSNDLENMFYDKSNLDGKMFQSLLHRHVRLFLI